MITHKYYTKYILIVIFNMSSKEYRQYMTKKYKNKKMYFKNTKATIIHVTSSFYKQRKNGTIYFVVVSEILNFRVLHDL